MKHAIGVRWLTNSNCDCNHFPPKFQSSYDILFIVKVKIRFLIWSYGSPHWCWLLSLKWLTEFEHVVQCVLNTSFWCPFLDPYSTTHHSNIGVRLRCVIELGLLTLTEIYYLDTWLCIYVNIIICLHRFEHKSMMLLQESVPSVERWWSRRLRKLLFLQKKLMWLRLGR